MSRFCATESCFNAIPKDAHPNQRYCEDCAKERTRLRSLNRKTRSKKKLRAMKKAKRRHTHCTYRYPDGHVCGHKLAESNITGKCYHHDSWAPLHARDTLYRPTLANVT